jgi:nicotinamide-nucleotide amidase
VPEAVAGGSLAALAHEVVTVLSARDCTVATAESLTGGLLAGALTSVPGASRVFRGGVVAYATDLKHELLGVDDALLARVGAVDQEVARQMATGVRTRLGADLGVATTGVAGPDPQDGHPPGTVWVAVADGQHAWAVAADRAVVGDRAAVRGVAVVAALRLLRDRLDASH